MTTDHVVCGRCSTRLAKSDAVDMQRLFKRKLRRRYFCRPCFARPGNVPEFVRQPWSELEDAQLLAIESLPRDEAMHQKGNPPLQKFARRNGRSYATVITRRRRLLKRQAEEAEKSQR